MTTLTEDLHASGFIASEANGHRSREEITVLSGQNLKAGAVVGKAAAGAATPAAVAGNTGDGVFGAVTVGAGVKAGVYRVTFIEPATDLGTFIVEDPDGINVGAGVVATAFTGGGLSFTIADGAANFVSGDAFTVTVAAGSGKVKEYNPANTDGSDVVAGVLYAPVDATAADAAGVIVARDAEVVGDDLLWFTGAVADDITAGKAGLAKLGIIAR
jgi:hypothetical protein